jgi:sensor histidine kinase regulating citrate/malate metabolism
VAVLSWYSCCSLITEHTGSDIVVTVEETEDGFAVQDNGDGILEEHIDDIFEFGYSSERRGTGFVSQLSEKLQKHTVGILKLKTETGQDSK